MPSTRPLLSLDLNLLVTLDVLLRERNVTRAAERLGLSQPAVSASLGRLRRHFDDELLSRVGNRYHLSPLGRRLAELTPYALDGVARVFEAADDFDPTSMERQFTIVVSDYGAAILGAELVRVAAEQAPGVRIRLEQTTPYVVDHASETLRAVDGVVLPHGFLTDLPHLELYHDDWVVLVSPDNDQVGERLTDHDLRTLPWVVLFDLPTAYSPSARHLQMIGVEVRVDVVVDSFLAMPFLVSGSNRLAMVQRRLADQVAGAHGLRVMETPYDSVVLAEAFWWHPVHQDDPAHRWLRGAVAEAGRRLAATSPAALQDQTVIDAADVVGEKHLLDS